MCHSAEIGAPIFQESGIQISANAQCDPRTDGDYASWRHRSGPAAQGGSAEISRLRRHACRMPHPDYSVPLQNWARLSNFRHLTFKNEHPYLTLRSPSLELKTPTSLSTQKVFEIRLYASCKAEICLSAPKQSPLALGIYHSLSE